MTKGLGRLFVCLALMVAGCQVEPEPQPLDFGSVVTDTTADIHYVRFKNHHLWKSAKIVGFQLDLPFTLEHPAETYYQTIAAGETSEPIGVKFFPLKFGKYNNEFKVFSRGVSTRTVKLTGNASFSSQKGGLELHYDGKKLDADDYISGPITFTDSIPQTFQVEVKNTSDSVFEGKVSLYYDSRYYTVLGLEESTVRIAANETELIEVAFNATKEGRWIDILQIREKSGERQASVVLFTSVLSTSISVKSRDQVVKEYIENGKNDLHNRNF